MCRAEDPFDAVVPPCLAVVALKHVARLAKASCVHPTLVAAEVLAALRAHRKPNLSSRQLRQVCGKFLTPIAPLLTGFPDERDECV